MISHFLAAILLVFLPNISNQEMYADDGDYPSENTAGGRGFLPITTGTDWKPSPLSLTSRVLRRSKPRFENILEKIRYYHLG
jgi:hypothetical protein